MTGQIMEARIIRNHIVHLPIQQNPGFEPFTDQELDVLVYGTAGQRSALYQKRYNDELLSTKAGRKAARRQRYQDMAVWMSLAAPKDHFTNAFIPNQFLHITESMILDEVKLYDLLSKDKPFLFPQAVCQDGSDLTETDKRRYIAMVGLPVTLVINSSIIFDLAFDIEYNPSAVNTTAIQIRDVTDPAGVIVRGNGHSLRQKIGNTKSGTIGITVQNCVNATVTGFRSVTKFTQLGIVTPDASLVGGNVTDLVLDDIRGFENGPPLATSGPIPGASIAAGGILLQSVNRVTLRNVTFRRNAGIGLGLIGVTGLKTEGNCYFQDSTSLYGGFPWGTFAANVFYSGFPFGLTPPYTDHPVSDIVINNLECGGARGKDSAFGAVLVSIPGLGLGTNGTIMFNDVNCTDTKQTATSPTFLGFPTGFAIGMVISGLNGHFKRCTVNGLTNAATTGNENQGFQSLGSNMIFEDCSCSGVKGSSAVEPMCSFGSDGIGNNIIVRNCVASDSVNSSAVVGQDSSMPNNAGFLFEQPITTSLQTQGYNVIIEDCKASGITAAAETGGGVGCWGTGMINGSITGCNFSGNDGGIAFADPHPSNAVARKWVVMNNQVIGNGEYGIREIGSGFDNVYLGNVSDLNGDNTTASNYMGVSANIAETYSGDTSYAPVYLQNSSVVNPPPAPKEAPLVVPTKTPCAPAAVSRCCGPNAPCQKTKPQAPEKISKNVEMRCCKPTCSCQVSKPQSADQITQVEVTQPPKDVVFEINGVKITVLQNTSC